MEMSGYDMAIVQGGVMRRILPLLMFLTVASWADELEFEEIIEDRPRVSRPAVSGSQATEQGRKPATDEGEGLWCAISGTKRICEFNSKSECETAAWAWEARGVIWGNCFLNVELRTRPYVQTVAKVHEAERKINRAGMMMLATIAVGIGTGLAAANTNSLDGTRTVLVLGTTASLVLWGVAGWNLLTVEF